jgi:hypothetical protein
MVKREVLDGGLREHRGLGKHQGRENPEGQSDRHSGAGHREGCTLLFKNHEYQTIVLFEDSSNFHLTSGGPVSDLFPQRQPVFFR